MSDTVKVVLDDDFCYECRGVGPAWTLATPADLQGQNDRRIHEIPAEQRDRWQQTMDAYEQMQAEISAILEARAKEAAKGPARHTPVTDVWSNTIAAFLKHRPSGGIIPGYAPGRDTVPAMLSPGRHTHIRPGETPSQADQRLLDGEDL